MSDNEDLAKLVDGAYKNILERFNPCARQLISAGKAYLKALHGAVAASKVYIDAIAKLARHAHQGTWGGCADIGTALMQLVDVQREIQTQQMNILKAFYIDLLAPLETNLEKDGKIVASEQKRFQQQHKSKQEAYLKATANMKKQKKKVRSSKSSLDKEIRHLHTLEEEKSKLDIFCEQNLKQAIIQERRRFGFVLERQCSLAKHYLAYHTKGQALLHYRLEEWQNIIRNRETLPESMKSRFPSCNGFYLGSEYACSNILEDAIGFGPMAPMRKTRSIDTTSCVETELKDFQEVPYARPLSRAKSDFNLASSSASLVSSDYVVPVRPKSLAEPNSQSNRQHVRALYSYLSSGEHQLCFHEGDVIALIGERNKGWHYGENLRNHRCGWFPIAYTEPVEHQEDMRDLDDTAASSPVCRERRHSSDLSTPTPSSDSSSSAGSRGVPAGKPRPMSAIYASSPGAIQVMMPPQRPLSTFTEGRTPEANKQRKVLAPPDENQCVAPPSLPSSLGTAPMPVALKSPTYAAIVTSGASPPLRPPRRSLTSPVPLPLPPPRLPPSFSLHSSNDSGFGNDSGSAQQSNKPEDAADDKPKDNIFATVKLRKVVTNDRSAPIIS